MFLHFSVFKSLTCLFFFQGGRIRIFFWNVLLCIHHNECSVVFIYRQSSIFDNNCRLTGYWRLVPFMSTKITHTKSIDTCLRLVASHTKYKERVRRSTSNPYLLPIIMCLLDTLKTANERNTTFITAPFYVEQMTNTERNLRAPLNILVYSLTC